MVTITKPDGTALVTDQSATGATSAWTYTLTPTQTAVLGVYKAVLTATVSEVVQTYTSWYEVAGGFFFETEEARAFDDSAMSSTTDYPTDKIIAAREQVEEDIEQVCGVAFVPRGKRINLHGTGTSRLLLPDLYVTSLVAAEVDGTALTTELDDLVIEASGRLILAEHSWDLGDRNVLVDYVHGYAQVPDPIKRAALMWTRARLVPTSLDDRATSHTDETGTRQLAVAGRRFPSGIPEVDAILSRYTERVPVLI